VGGDQFPLEERIESEKRTSRFILDL
jgi:hypothetical protein